MTTLRQLETFITVAEYKKMSEAAKKLFISQPTVSQIISNLEEEYQVQLFERYPKELKITTAGRELLTHAREIVAVYENLEQSMKNINALRPLRIGATLTIGNTMMSDLISELKTCYPDIDATIFINNTRTIEQRLIHNELDIALVEGIIVREEILTDPVMDDHLVLLCACEHPFASRTDLTLADLHEQDFILREYGSGTRAIFENIMLTHHIPFNTKWECNSSTAIIDAVRHNLGLGVLSYRCVQDVADKGEICICPLNGISMKRFFYLCYNKNHPVTSQMRDFITIVRES